MNIQLAATLFLFPTLALAQVPPTSVLVATQTSTVNQSLVSVDTSGTGTLLTNYGRGVHTAVALDRHDVDRVRQRYAVRPAGDQRSEHELGSGPGPVQLRNRLQARARARART